MNVRLIVAAVGGAGVGALFAWAITADYYDDKLKLSRQTNSGLRRQVQVEIEARQSYEHVFADALEATGVIPGDVGTPLANNVMESEPENPRGDETDEVDGAGGDEEVDEATEEATRSNLQSIIDSYTANPEDRDTFVEKAVFDAPEKNEQPFVIPRETFAWDDEGEEFEKITVTYYPRARVVLEEDDVLEDPGQILGWRNLNRFGDESGDPDTVFIRNRRLMTDYEVVKDDEGQLPLHVKYGLPKEEYAAARAAGTLRLREEDL